MSLWSAPFICSVPLIREKFAKEMPTVNEDKKSVKRLSILLVLIAGIIIGLYATWNVYRGYVSQSWPATEGVIVDSFLAGSTRIIGRKAFLKYAYSVDEQRYIGRLISYTWKCVDYHGAIEIMRAYPIDQQVLVYYDPDNPDKAVLRTELSGRIGWLFVLSTLTILIALRGLQWQSLKSQDHLTE